MSVGLAIIARDEADSLPDLLASVVDAFDQVVLADTGSTDRTVEVFTEWAEAQDLPLGWRVESFEWCDDFSAAREFADSLLDTDWRTFADADDELGAPWELRKLAASAPPNVACLAFDYLGDRSPGPRIRMTRKGFTRWDGRAHPVPILTRPGTVATIPANVAVWMHRRSSWASSDERDRRILARWLEDEPDNPRALALSGDDSLRVGDFERAARSFRRYLDCPTTRAAFGTAGLAKARAALAKLDAGEATAAVTNTILFGGLAG